MGYHWIGGSELIEKIEGVDTAQKCQQLCNQKDECNWFTWRDNTNPTGCWLLANKGTTKDIDMGRNQGATGPKNCDGKHI